MKISLMDRSLYFKGLVLLLGKDRQIHARERALLLRVGKRFSFERGFCEEVIDGILTNEHVVDEPPVFDDQQVARCLVRDGLRLAAVDGQLHDRERGWLQAICKANGLAAAGEVADLQPPETESCDEDAPLEAERFVWE